MKRISKRLLLLSLVLLVLISCKEQAFDKHYERPSWLKGNAWELLESEGNYKIFLDAVTKSGNQSLVQGKGIVTVMAPSDEAFNAYFQKKGLSGIDQLSISELRKLIGYHLVYYSYNRDQLSNFKPYGSGSVRLNEEGLFYKHRTYSRDTISTRIDPSDGKTKTVFHKERFLPVLSANIFNTKGIDAKYNYEYFYDDASEWTGGTDGFNVSNASVKEYSIPTDNGYVYFIDAVLDPLETIYTEMNDQAEYTSFLELYDRFIYFWYDRATSSEFAEIGDSLFIVRYNGLPEIASEWSYNGEFVLPDYADLPALSGTAYNVFAPNNTAIDNFFNSYWKGFYNSIDEIGYLPIGYLLYNHVNQGSIVFPEEITQGLIKTPYGNSIIFDPDADVKAKKMCVNGTFYGLESVIVPDFFKSVTGPAFQDPQYKMFLYMLANTGMIGPLMSDALDFTVLMPNDEVVQNILFENSYIYWNEGNPNIFGDERVEVENDNGARTPMGTSSMLRFVQNHIVNEAITDFGTKKVYRTRNSFSYIFIAGDTVDTNQSFNKGGGFNLTEITGDWTNGKVYATDNVLFREAATIKSLIASTSSNTNELNHISEFGKLLAQAGLIQPDAELDFLLGDEFLLFAPSNDAIIAAQNAGQIPTDQAELAKYLKYYFVSLSRNSITDYPFEGFGIEGEWKTAQFITSGENSKLSLEDNGAELILTDATGAKATVISAFPNTYSDGAVYSIDNVLKAE